MPQQPIGRLIDIARQCRPLTAAWRASPGAVFFT